VVTGGTDTGVMALVGRALRTRNLEARFVNNEVPLIGVAPFGTVMHREQLYNAHIRKSLDELAHSSDERHVREIALRTSEPPPTPRSAASLRPPAASTCRSRRL
jgi:hypothetical protein